MVKTRNKEYDFCKSPVSSTERQCPYQVEYQWNSDVSHDVIDYVLCSVSSNKLFIKIILLLLDKISFEGKMHIQTLREMDFRYEAVVAKFPIKISYS